MIRTVKNPIIEIHDLTVSYNKKPVLWDIDFSLPQGKIIGILGPNGAGKSTLLKSMMNLIPIDCGYVKFFDNCLKNVRQLISYVPQKGSVDWDFPISVFEVVLMGRYGSLGLFNKPTKVDKEIALEALKKVGLVDYQNRQISQLSGGQQQRVFIARALAQQAQIYLMDEPFAAIDKTTEDIVIQVLNDLTLENKTILVVHHNWQTVKEYFHWCVLLNMRLVASSYTDEVITDDLLKETYNGKSDILSHVGKILYDKKISPREPNLS